MTIQELKHKIIDDGIDNVKKDKNLQPNHINGSIRGFEMCRNISVESIEPLTRLLTEQREEDINNVQRAHNGYMSMEDYWEKRYATIQIEYVYEIMQISWINLSLLDSGTIVEGKASKVFKNYIKNQNDLTL